MARVLIGLGVLIAFGILFLVGQFVLGARREGGLRTLGFIVGLGSAVLGSGLIYVADAILLLIPLGAAFLLFGLYCMGAALFASNRHIAKWMPHLFDGF